MDLMWCLILAGVWGGFWALFLQGTRMGQFLASKRAYLAVVIGVGVDLLIVLPMLDVLVWLRIVAVIGVSSIGLVVRSLWNEFGELMDTIEEISRGD